MSKAAISSVIFTSFSEWEAYSLSMDEPLHASVLRYECNEHNTDAQSILSRLSASYDVMCASVQEGLTESMQSRSGMVSGSGRRIFSSKKVVLSREFQQLVASSVAAKELNACMGRVVAAPTAGASGILPGVLTTLEKRHGLSRERILHAMLVSAGIGLIIERRASISGAVGGCQAETGAAAAMASGAIVHALEGTQREVFNAVAITIQCTMGLVCDPVAGLVEVPCIVRNASAAAIAFSSAQIAVAEADAVIPVDECVDAMAEVAQSMETRYKETAQGGLAATPTGKRIQRELAQKQTQKEEKNASKNP